MGCNSVAYKNRISKKDSNKRDDNTHKESDKYHNSTKIYLKNVDEWSNGPMRENWQSQMSNTQKRNASEPIPK